MKDGGYTAQTLCEFGYQCTKLIQSQVFTGEDCVKAGYSIKSLREASVSAETYKKHVGFKIPAKSYKEAGFKLEELTPLFAPMALKDAFPLSELAMRFPRSAFGSLYSEAELDSAFKQQKSKTNSKQQKSKTNRILKNLELDKTSKFEPLRTPQSLCRTKRSQSYIKSIVSDNMQKLFGTNAPAGDFEHNEMKFCIVREKPRVYQIKNFDKIRYTFGYALLKYFALVTNNTRPCTRSCSHAHAHTDEHAHVHTHSHIMHTPMHTHTFMLTPKAHAHAHAHSHARA